MPSSNPDLTFPRIGLEDPSYVEQPINESTLIQTRYMKMLLEQNKIPSIHNLQASLFTWLLLAGYLVFPGTFILTGWRQFA